MSNLVFKKTEKLDYVILHMETNDLASENNVDRIAKSTIDSPKNSVKDAVLLAYQVLCLEMTILKPQR